MIVSEVTFSSITVQWEAVPCIHRNGDITGYSVQYREVGNGSTQTFLVLGDKVTVSNLMSFTIYTIEVAAVNSEGIGPVSYPLIVDTLTGMGRFYIQSHNYIIMSIYSFIPRHYVRFIFFISIIII